MRYTRILKICLALPRSLPRWGRTGAPDNTLVCAAGTRPTAETADALIYAAHLHGSRREGHIAYEQAEAALALLREQGLALRLAQATVMRGWALVEQGQGDAGIAQIRQGIAAERATGSRAAGHLALLAKACWHLGQREEGLRVVAEALAIENSDGGCRWTAELSRLQGELLAPTSEHHTRVCHRC